MNSKGTRMIEEKAGWQFRSDVTDDRSTLMWLTRICTEWWEWRQHSGRENGMCILCRTHHGE